MKYKQLINLSLAALIVTVLACESKKEEKHEEQTAEQTSKREEWKEMDDFHMVMAEAFHPYKDSSNLEPVKTKAGDLAASANTWASAPLPEKVNNDEVKAKLAQLKTDAEALAVTVKSADDETIAASLTKLHDLFHELQEAWYGGHHDHH